MKLSMNPINLEVCMSALALSPEERRHGVERRECRNTVAFYPSTRPYIAYVGSEMIDKFNGKYGLEDRRQHERRYA